MCPCCQFRGVDWTTDARPMYVSLSQCLLCSPDEVRGGYSRCAVVPGFHPGYLSFCSDLRPPVAGVADYALFVHAGQLTGVQQLFAADPQVLDAGASAGIEQL